MRLLYTSPRQENIDRVAAFMAENGIETTITNRSNWNRPSYQRFSYSQRSDNRDAWPQVWVRKADDYTKARELLRKLGIEPEVRHAEELRMSRDPVASMYARREHTVARVRRIVLLSIVGVFMVLALRYLHII
jgi:arsenate reductase-like glutaredoxin family protein